MDLFFNIDWNNLKANFDKLLGLSYDSAVGDPKTRRNVLKALYFMEADFEQIKRKLNLVRLDASITSESVNRSLSWQNQGELFPKSELPRSGEYLRENDYQYWFLIYLLLRHNDIISKDLKRYEIVGDFVDRVKDNSFIWEDIELLKSGQPRCLVNLGFMFSDLKKVGLVNLYDSGSDESWTLTYLGFFVAASLCVDPLDKEKKPFSDRITRFGESTYYNKINSAILQRTSLLSGRDYFLNLVRRMQLESLDLKELERGPEIFGGYYNFFTVEMEKLKRANEKEEALSAFLSELDEQYDLSKYMKELSEKFNAEKFFGELMKGANL